MQEVSRRAKSIAELTNASRMQTGRNLGFVEGVDKKGLNTALNQLSQSKAKAISAVLGNEMLSDEERQKSIASAESYYADEERKVLARFGAENPGGGAGHGGGERGGAGNLNPNSDWIGGDQSKADFYKLAVSKGVDLTRATPDQLDAYYKQYQSQAKLQNDNATLSKALSLRDSGSFSGFNKNG